MTKSSMAITTSPPSHLIAYLRNEPVATLRIRWFASFAKIERVSVMKHVRGGALVKLMIETAVEMIGVRVIVTVLGYIRKRLVPFWKQLGLLPARWSRWLPLLWITSMWNASANLPPATTPSASTATLMWSCARKVSGITPAFWTDPRTDPPSPDRWRLKLRACPCLQT